MRTPRERAIARASVGAALALLLALLAGCSDDPDGPADPAEKDRPSGQGTSAVVRTDAEVGAVRGRLSKAATADVLTEVTTVVDRWVDAAYAGDYPRSSFKKAFRDFTKDARALALRQDDVLSNAGVGADLDGVEVTKRLVRVDVLAPKGKVAGATVRFRLTLELTGEVERTDLVAGRLLMTPARGGWQVFGFDVRRDEKGS